MWRYLTLKHVIVIVLFYSNISGWLEDFPRNIIRRRLRLGDPDLSSPHCRGWSWGGHFLLLCWRLEQVSYVRLNSRKEGFVTFTKSIRAMNRKQLRLTPIEINWDSASSSLQAWTEELKYMTRERVEVPLFLVINYYSLFYYSKIL